MTDLIRNMLAAAQTVAGMADERVAIFAAHDPEIFRAIARAFLKAATELERGAPEGWVLRPAEPTAEMLEAGRRLRYSGAANFDAADIYRAMNAAAPPPPVERGLTPEATVRLDELEGFISNFANADDEDDEWDGRDQFRQWRETARTLCNRHPLSPPPAQEVP